MSQDALIPVTIRGNRLTAAVELHVQTLRDQGLIRAEHELLCSLVMSIAEVAGTVKGYAAGPVFRELREAIQQLPKPPESPEPGPLDEALRAAPHFTD